MIRRLPAINAVHEPMRATLELMPPQLHPGGRRSRCSRRAACRPAPSERTTVPYRNRPRGDDSMKIRNIHERTIAAPPEQIAQLLADFEGIWPTQIAPAPRAQGERLYKTSVMLWQEYDRPGAARAFRVLSPAELQGENWFELERAPTGTLVRHTVQGEALGDYEAIWRERIEPAHDIILEAVLDNIEAALAPAASSPRSSISSIGAP